MMLMNFIFPSQSPEGKFKGIVFITFEDSAATKKALEYNEQDYMGRNIIVEIAASKSRDNRPTEKPADCRGLRLFMVFSMSSFSSSVRSVTS